MVKLTTLEKALLTYIGVEKVAPGITKRSLIATVKGLGRISPPVARGALGVGRAALGGAATLARRQPVIAAGATLYALNELGHLEPVKRELGEFPQTFREALPRFEGPHVREAIDPFLEPVRKAKKKVSSFNRAVSKGMKTIKASTSYGKKGVISNSKAAFKTATKQASAAFRGKKAPKSGPGKVAYTAAKKVYKDEILRRKMK